MTVAKRAQGEEPVSYHSPKQGIARASGAGCEMQSSCLGLRRCCGEVTSRITTTLQQLRWSHVASNLVCKYINNEKAELLHVQSVFCQLITMRLSLLAFVQALFTPRVLAQGACSADGRPNIVFIFTDDQDRRLGSTDYQPILQRELAAKGTEFINHFSTVAQCCPSRSSLFRGQAAHNTNITNVSGAGSVNRGDDRLR